MIAVTACDRHLSEVQVGQPIVVSAELPDEGNFFEYTWRFITIPDSSRLDSDSLLFHARDQEIAFTPDVLGHYVIQVVIWQYNDKLATQFYRYEANNLVTSPAGIAELDDKWLGQKPGFPAKIIINESIKSESLASSIPLINDKNHVVHMDSILEPVFTDQQSEPRSPTTQVNVVGDNHQQMFTIQVASKNTIRAAWDMVEALISDGYDAYIQKSESQVDGKIWYRVRIGQYNSRKAAEKAAETISHNRNLPTWVDFLREERPEVNKQED
ncbi:MAG: SPOR domain-containing protein [Candidatus Neomarinimicrobiota bacterium]